MQKMNKNCNRFHFKFYPIKFDHHFLFAYATGLAQPPSYLIEQAKKSPSYESDLNVHL